MIAGYASIKKTKKGQRRERDTFAAGQYDKMVKHLAPYIHRGESPAMALSRVISEFEKLREMTDVTIAATSGSE